MSIKTRSNPNVINIQPKEDLYDQFDKTVSIMPPVIRLPLYTFHDEEASIDAVTTCEHFHMTGNYDLVKIFFVVISFSFRIKLSKLKGIFS